MKFRIRRGYLKKRMETKDTKIPATIYINMKFIIGEVTLALLQALHLGERWLD